MDSIHICNKGLTAGRKLRSFSINNMLCAQKYLVLVRSKKSKFYHSLQANFRFKRIICYFKKRKGRKNCLWSFRCYRGFQGGFRLCLHCSIELIQRARRLILLASQFQQSINKDLFNNQRRFFLLFLNGDETFFALSTLWSAVVRSR